ncbi:MAG: SRPBCC domain-containing protein [Bacteroidota bacterium]
MKENSIHFPENYLPNDTPVYARNEIFINAPEEKIWDWLTKITTWPDWYPNSSNIRVLNQDQPKLLEGTRFKWRTFKTNIESEVKEFKPFRYLAWEAKGFGLSAYHGWLIIPQDNGCQVITEESQYGWLPSLGRSFITKGLLKQHQIWLEGLKQKSEAFNVI